MNHLAAESSPYLLQHRDNPVDWYPWGDDAFNKSVREDRPIFLSIGYATCHWCHVMEHESFADEEVAALMNRWFVSIKVDREERPDIDNIYMTVCQLMGGHCGWPLNVVLTPDKKPFFVATYIPRTSRHGRAGMLDLLPRIAEVWEKRRDEVIGSANEVTGALQSLSARRGGVDGLGSDGLKAARDQLGERFDPVHGGFGGAPKFPSPHNLLFLLRYGRRTGDAEAVRWATTTLRAMRLGGIFDQIGFGFHRYSTDAVWRLPHFEKMLYDQALHVMAYAEAFLATGDPLFRKTAVQVAEYVLRDLTSERGAFFSAEDADSEGVEGKFYVWSTDQLKRLFGTDDAERLAAVLNMKDGGNFKEEATGRYTGENVPYLDESGEVFALGGDRRLENGRQELFRAREERPRPLLDDKILTDWNGLMIGALAYAGRALGEEALTRSAGRAAAFVVGEMYDEQAGLYHRCRNGDVGIGGLLDDYTFLSWGMTELYQATLNTEHLAVAVRLTEDSIDRFWDDSEGGFFLAPQDRTDLLVRAKDFNDGAIPSGNAIGLMNLVRLGRMTGRAGFEEMASALREASAPYVLRLPSAFTALLLGVEFLRSPSETVLAGRRDDPALLRMHRRLNGEYLPGNVVVRVDAADEDVQKLAPYTSEYRPPTGEGATAYVCRNYACAAPATTADEMMSRFADLP